MWALILVTWAAVNVIADWRRSGLVWWDYAHLRVARVYSQLWHRWSTNASYGLPRTGPVIVVPNHTCSADPTFLLGGSGRVMSFLVSREHFDVHPLCRMILDYLDCVPVDRNGRDAGAARQGLYRLLQGKALCVFPEGGLSGVERNRILVPRLGAAWLALKSKAPVVPVCIRGGPRTNELLNSWVFPSAGPLRVIFGCPIDLSPYHGQPLTRKLLYHVATLIMQQVHALHDQSP